MSSWRASQVYDIPRRATAHIGGHKNPALFWRPIGHGEKCGIFGLPSKCPRRPPRSGPEGRLAQGRCFGMASVTSNISCKNPSRCSRDPQRWYAAALWSGIFRRFGHLKTGRPEKMAGRGHSERGHSERGYARILGEVIFETRTLCSAEKMAELLLVFYLATPEAHCNARNTAQSWNCWRASHYFKPKPVRRRQRWK